MFIISRTRLLTGAATLALTASLGATPGLGQETDTAQMQVTASVAQSCDVTSDGPLNFPAPASTESSTTNSSFTVTCTADGTVQVKIDGGQHSQNGTRHMANNGDLMPYNLHRTDGFNDAWGINQQFDQVVSDTTPVTLEVHGIVTNSAFTSAAAGDYTDTITMTVTF